MSSLTHAVVMVTVVIAHLYCLINGELAERVLEILLCGKGRERVGGRRGKKRESEVAPVIIICNCIVLKQ